MKFVNLLLFLSLFNIIGCKNSTNEEKDRRNERWVEKYLVQREECKNGVLYYKEWTRDGRSSIGFMAVAFTPKGEVIKCQANK